MKTIETTITWYNINEKEPNNDDLVLICLRDNFISTCKWWDYICCPQIKKIKYWAFLPDITENIKNKKEL